MNTLNQDWIPITMPFSDDLNDALQQQHHAAQFIALVGRYLIPQQPDDSNTNMNFELKNNTLVGNKLPDGISVVLNINNLNISILDQGNNSRNIILFDGKTTQKVFDLLKQDLSDLKIDVTTFKNILHYEIPVHPLDKGIPFSVKDKHSFIENTNYRHNAEIVLNEITSNLNEAGSVKVWPHHFDTGSSLPVSRNEKGEVTQSIGIGWANPDSMVDEPYYYLSFWSENPVGDFKNLLPLSAGEWITSGWKGGLLKHSEILAFSGAEEQFQHVKLFFDSGIEILINQFGHK